MDLIVRLIGDAIPRCLHVMRRATRAGVRHPRAGHGAGRSLMKPSAWMTLSLALMASAASASDLASLVDLPVTGSVLVPASKYSDAVSRAARTGSPVDIALNITGTFEGSRQLIVQTNEGAESPAASRVTVIRDGLLDDAVRTERWDITLARTAAGSWEIRGVTKAWRCWRGAMTASFAVLPCP
jgi:hypothetical protein